MDITRFKTQLDDFDTAFGCYRRLASNGFKEAVQPINQAINDLENTKTLSKSANNLRLAS